MGRRMLKLLSHTGASGLGGRSHDTLLRAASCYKDLLLSEMPQEENQTNVFAFHRTIKIVLPAKPVFHGGGSVLNTHPRALDQAIGKCI